MEKINGIWTKVDELEDKGRGVLTLIWNIPESTDVPVGCIVVWRYKDKSGHIDFEDATVEELREIGFDINEDDIRRLQQLPGL